MCFSTRVSRYASLECLALGEGGLARPARGAKVDQTAEERLGSTYIFEHTLAAS